MVAFTRMLMIAMIVAVGSQFSLNFFMEGFIITLAVVLLPLLMEVYRPVNPLLTCLITAIVSPLFRMVLMTLQNQDFSLSLRLVAPDAVFYVVYGIVFSTGYRLIRNNKPMDFAAVVLLSDFFANLTEVMVRSHWAGVELRLVKALFLIAVIRTFIALAGWIGIRGYRSFLAREEHENRYRRLMMLISGFKSEIYFMNMNMQQIEDIMSKSFQAYKLSQETGASGELQNLTLDISKDVHEIKKDYIRVIKGLEAISESKVTTDPMHIRDLVQLLMDSLRETPLGQNDVPEIEATIKCDVQVVDHYYLMSILRNLVINSIEACKDGIDPRVQLLIEHQGDFVVIQCQDNGHGIKPSDQAYIFSPGFSTKYDMTSGTMNRGLGLTLVRELAETHFSGQVTVESSVGVGTRFKIEIPYERLAGGSSCGFAS